MSARILLVEDEPAIAESVAYALSRDGFTVEIASSAAYRSRSPMPTVSMPGWKAKTDTPWSWVSAARFSVSLISAAFDTAYPEHEGQLSMPAWLVRLTIMPCRRPTIAGSTSRAHR